MKPAPEWAAMLASHAPRDTAQLIEGRRGLPTLSVNGALLHSKYDPEQEAQRLIESATLEPGRPVVVLGLGLGYHVAELLKRGIEVAVIEPDPDVAALALRNGAAREGFNLWVGPLEELRRDAGFAALARRAPQVFPHPPTARLHPGTTEALNNLLAADTLRDRRFNIAVVGPMYGGSQPIAGYLQRAFASLGHNAVLIDNAMAWPLYQAATAGESRQAAKQLGGMLAHFLSEWTYARVAEFDPEICIVLAQAPVGDAFPARLAKLGIVSAFWYVENWRHLPYWQEVAPRYDAFFHIQPGEFESRLDAAGCRHHAFVQTGCDPDLHRPVALSEAEQAEFGCDVSFAGAGYYNRLQLFKGLTDLNFKLWGVDWPERELAPLVQGGERRFDYETFMKIVAGSHINLNLHSSATHDGVDPNADALNPRIFEIAAAGGFQLCDPCRGLDAHFAEDEVPTYRSLAELREKIVWYIAHPEERKAVAARARKRALAEHTYAHRAAEMLDFLLDRHAGKIQRKGVREQLSAATMAAELEEGDPLRDWLLTIPPETPFTQEAIGALIGGEFARRSYPENIFCYMREVRGFAETLFKEQR